MGAQGRKKEGWSWGMEGFGRCACGETTRKVQDDRKRHARRRKERRKEGGAEKARGKRGESEGGYAAARWRGVQEEWVRWLTLASRASSARTTPACPYSDASCSAVLRVGAAVRASG
eukprot:2248969-Rhodomonas_salina.1